MEPSLPEILLQQRQLNTSCFFCSAHQILSGTHLHHRTDSRSDTFYARAARRTISGSAGTERIYRLSGIAARDFGHFNAAGWPPFVCSAEFCYSFRIQSDVL